MSSCHLCRDGGDDSHFHAHDAQSCWKDGDNRRNSPHYLKHLLNLHWRMAMKIDSQSLRMSKLARS